MAAPTVVGVGAYLTGVSSSTAAIPIPAGTAVGDIAVCLLYTEDVTAPPGMPSGFNILVRPVGASHQLLVAWKRLTAADSGTYTFTTTFNWREGSCVVIRGCVGAGNPFDVATSAIGTGPTSPAVSLTTTVPDVLLLWAGTNFNGGTWTMPGGWTSRVAGSDLGAASLVQATAGATGSITGSSTGGAVVSLGALIALRPAIEIPAPSWAGTWAHSADYTAGGIADGTALTAHNADFAVTGTAGNLAYSTATGAFVAASSGGSLTCWRYTALPGAPTDYEALALIRTRVNSDFCYLGVRASGTIDPTFGTNGYTVFYDSAAGNWLLYESPANSNLASLATPDPAAGELWWTRIQCEGSTIRARVWRMGTAEPGTWGLTATDATRTTGEPVLALELFSNSGVANEVHAFAAAPLNFGLSAVDQEGFRWYADGTEAGAVATQAQDVDDTAAVGDLRILRILLNATGDVPSFAPVLRAQKNGAGGYVPVPVGASVPEAFGTVTFGAIGTGANGTTTVAPSYPAGITAGQYLTCEVSSGATNSEVPTTPSGWTLLATGASTDGAFGIDTGPRRSTVFGKVATGSETGTLTVSITNGNTCRGTITRWTKTGGDTWDVVGVGGNDSTSGTGVSIAFGSVNWHNGDAVLVATGQRVDGATQSAQSLTATGITFGTRTNRAATAVTTGNDIRHTVDTFAAVTNADPSEDAAPTWAYTASAAASAGGVLVRLRAYTAPVTNEIYVSPSSSITAGGEATTARETPPAGKTTAEFLAGGIWDNENGTDTFDLGADQWSVFGWVLATQAPAVDGDFWDFRVYEGAAAADTYGLTPRLTLGTVGGTTHNRSNSETATATDTVSRSSSISRARTEAATAADVASRSTGTARAGAETSTATDATTKAVVKALTLAETATASDAATRGLVATRSRTEAATAADAITRTLTLARARQETATATDVASRTFAAARSAGDGSTASDLLSHQLTSGGVTHNRSVADGSLSTDSAARAVVWVRSRSEAATAVDAVARALSVARSRAETATATDAVIRALSAARTRAEVATALDSATRAVAWARARTETAAASDVMSTGAVLSISISDTSVATDVLSRAVQRFRTFSEAGVSTDAAQRALGALRSLSEAPTATDTAQRASNALRSLLEAATATDAATAIEPDTTRVAVPNRVVSVRLRSSVSVLPRATATLRQPPTATLLIRS